MARLPDSEEVESSRRGPPWKPCHKCFMSRTRPTDNRTHESRHPPSSDRTSSINDRMKDQRRQPPQAAIQISMSKCNQIETGTA